MSIKISGRTRVVIWSYIIIQLHFYRSRIIFIDHGQIKTFSKNGKTLDSRPFTIDHSGVTRPLLFIVIQINLLLFGKYSILSVFWFHYVQSNLLCFYKHLRKIGLLVGIKGWNIILSAKNCGKIKIFNFFLWEQHKKDYGNFLYD